MSLSIPREFFSAEKGKKEEDEEEDEEDAAGHALNPPVPPLKAVNTALQSVSQSVNSIEKLRETMSTGQLETMQLNRPDAQL